MTSCRQPWWVDFMLHMMAMCIEPFSHFRCLLPNIIGRHLGFAFRAPPYLSRQSIPQMAVETPKDLCFLHTLLGLFARMMFWYRRRDKPWKIRGHFNQPFLNFVLNNPLSLSKLFSDPGPFPLHGHDLGARSQDQTTPLNKGVHSSRTSFANKRCGWFLGKGHFRSSCSLAVGPQA